MKLRCTEMQPGDVTHTGCPPWFIKTIRLYLFKIRFICEDNNILLLSVFGKDGKYTTVSYTQIPTRKKHHTGGLP